MRPNRLVSTIAVPALSLALALRTAHAQQPSVHGEGTVGNLSMWTGTTSSGRSILGDSLVTQWNGNVGVGVAAPTSRLAVQGMVEAVIDGYKFPDGTVQTTAAVTGLQSVAHDDTLAGDGTGASPLGLSVPLVLNGAPLQGVISVWDRNDTGSGLFAMGGGDGGDGRGGTAVVAIAGGSVSGFGGDGIYGEGGRANEGVGGRGVYARGGRVGSGEGGHAVDARGGGSEDGSGGSGVYAQGGPSTAPVGGAGVIAQGGYSETQGGPGVRARGYSMFPGGLGGTGVVATGGYGSGRAVIATGGVGSGGFGVEATGGAAGIGSSGAAGVVAVGGSATGPNSASGHGIVASAGPAEDGANPGAAAVFGGRVSVSGELNLFGDLDVTGTKNFRIDHPLDPANKYLLHAAVESSEVLNVYSGNAVTDAGGRAVVTLPEWFEALNKDLRYQLTVIGTFAQAIVAEKVRGNRFTIGTSAPNVEVSWQVTGVRSDASMAQRPFRAEEDKPRAERGTYLHPEAFGQPEERGVARVRYPDLMRDVSDRRRVHAHRDASGERDTRVAERSPETASAAGQQ